MEALLPRLPANLHENCNALLRNVRASDLSPDGAPPQSEPDYSSDTVLGNRARVSKRGSLTIVFTSDHDYA
jgi:hypothetical protein